MNSMNNPNDSMPTDAIDTLEKIQGRFPGARRAHAKGLFFEATFTPNGNAIAYTTAAHLQKEAVSATVRFSNSPPNPTASDFLSPFKGMSVQFHLPDGTASHLISTTIPIFITKDPKTFIDMLKILTATKTGLDKVDLAIGVLNIIKKYPERKNILLALQEQFKQPPISYSFLHYYPIHAFYFVNQDGKCQAIKYEWQPVQEKEAWLEKPASKITSPDYLEEDLHERLKNGPVSFNLVIRLGTEDDATDDPTVDWPEDRQQIIVGQLTLNKALFPNDPILFDPTIVTEGIELTADPILHFRHDAYAVSYNRRMKNE
ncbi:catalase family peroxidase [Psychrobacillus sp. NEAU-3TGS]|uniref:catalase family peroxidase n=1 Tax=Psychrobacillus sp. NEAU-3TGS TaxID=2995412 RepID=UPI0024998815|nr:catalase family peroxidase [Psychrobacillus sp. NEAU-3TGS]MDI2586633.1 catalase family peroxidase [Psychrobacillus sp. NEAU-3TGS]